MRKSLILVLVLYSMNCQAAFNIPIIYSDENLTDTLGYGDGCFQTNGEEFVLRQYLKPGDVVFDVGASRGFWSLIALQIEPSIHLHSFEPLPVIFETLKSNIRLPSKVYQLALSDRIGTGSFYALDGEESEGSGLFFRPYLRGKYRVIQIDLDTIDHICEVNSISKIDYLKIDTEGGELKVLQGARDLLFSHRISALQFEYGGTYPDAQITLKEVMEFLTQAGYVIFRLSPYGIVHIARWEDSLENYRYANYFAIIQSLCPMCNLVSGL